MGLRRVGSDRHLPAVLRLRKHRLRRSVHLPHRGQMAPHRPVEIARVSGLGSDLSALLDRQGADPRQPDDLLRRQSLVRAVPASAGRADRQRGHDPLPQRSGLPRSAHGRGRHGDPQRLVLPLLPGARRPYPDRPGHPRPGRVHRREDRARHRHVDGRRGSTRPHVHAVQRSGGPGRSALARVPGTAHGARLPEDRAGPMRHAAPGPASVSSPCFSCSSSTCRWLSGARTCW